jgi:hypothetical protein
MQPIASSRSTHVTPIEFVYTGATALTAIGGATRHCYRFDFPGCLLPVHPRDAPGLQSIAALRRIE